MLEPDHLLFRRQICMSRDIRYYSVNTINVLTGFKFIGEQLGVLEKEGRKDSYIFGFETKCFKEILDIGNCQNSWIREVLILVLIRFLWLVRI